MKLTTLIIIVFSLFYSHNSIAQEDYEWNNMAFTLTDDFDVIRQGRNELIAEGDGIEISVEAFKDNEIDADNMSDFTIALAASLNLEEIDDVAELELNGLEGAYVEGYKNGDRIFLMGMIDPDTDDNFVVIITFDDEDDFAEKTAIFVLQSFRQQ